MRYRAIQELDRRYLPRARRLGCGLLCLAYPA